MSDQEHQETNGTSNGDVPEIELIIKVRTCRFMKLKKLIYPIDHFVVINSISGGREGVK